MPIAISVNCQALGDTLAALPAIKKISKAYETPITVFSAHSYLFKNHPSVKESFDLSAPKEKYTVLNTFNQLAGKKLSIGDQTTQFKHSQIHISQFHALSLGFTLLPEEMEMDLYIKENWNLPYKNYVVIHPTHTWPSRTWDIKNWQDLVYKLNNKGIPVIAIGKTGKEHGNLGVYEKTPMNIEIPYGENFMDSPKSTIPKLLGLLDKADYIITMDSGVLHLAGTTDSEIIQLGSSINPKYRAPFRRGSQDYKYRYVGGKCDLFCASNLKYNVKVHGHLQETPPLSKCLENKPTFECHSSVDEIIKHIKSLPKVNKKLLYITPHLSTGGAPQYLLKKIELLKDEFDIYLVEYTDLGGKSFVVQKNKIFNIIPLKPSTLGKIKLYF